MCSAKPKSAWQIETKHHHNDNFAYTVQPNPNLPGRLKPTVTCLFVSSLGGVQPNPNLPGRLKPGMDETIIGSALGSAKPKSAWQIETKSAL